VVVVWEGVVVPNKDDVGAGWETAVAPPKREPVGADWGAPGVVANNEVPEPSESKGRKSIRIWERAEKPTKLGLRCRLPVAPGADVFC